MVELGLRPEEYWDLTARDFYFMSLAWAAGVDRENERYGSIIATQYNVLPRKKGDTRKMLTWRDFYPSAVAVIRGIDLKPGQGLIEQAEKPPTTLAEYHEYLRNLSDEQKEELKRFRDRAFMSFGGGKKK